MVLECDVGVYSSELFTKVRSSLEPKGRFVIIDQLAEVTGQAPAARLSWALQDSLQDPDYVYPSVDKVVGDLEASGFRILRTIHLPGNASEPTQIDSDMILIEAQM